MPLYRTPAIVLRSMNLSDADKIVTFLSRNYGKVKCVAKAARRIKSRYGASLEPMSHLSLIYFGKENQSLYKVSQCDIVQSFQSVRENHHKFYTGIYFLELADSLTAEAHPEPNIFDLLIDGLKQVQIQDDLETLCRFFEMRIISLAGYKPRLNKCIQCNKVPQSRQVGYSFSRQGIVCGTCMNDVGYETRINNGTLGYLKKLMSLDIQRTDRIKIPKGTEAEVESITHRLILSRLGR